MKNYQRINFENEYKEHINFQNTISVKHRWYPFVEGYSHGFIESIINEYISMHGEMPQLCIDPFAGSGTTALELQNYGVSCHTFEVNPFMHLLACTKLSNSYCSSSIKDFIKKSLVYFKNPNRSYAEDIKKYNFNTFIENGKSKKWNFDKVVFKGILDIKRCIELYSDEVHKNLYKIALASILLEVSNVYRNGKCVSYKKNWKNKKLKKTDVHTFFINKLQNIFLEDIIVIESSHKKEFSNEALCHFGNVFDLIPNTINDNSIDLVITSPPYLNSRDYTDSYMIEIKALGFFFNTSDIMDLRKKTMRSHVQVSWDKVEYNENDRLNLAMQEILKYEKEFWNTRIPLMINGYFKDIDKLFEILSQKMKIGGLIYFNVANSAYFGVKIDTDFICADIAEKWGFITKEIRIARYINPSSQQKSVGKLIESVILFEKKR